MMMWLIYRGKALVKLGTSTLTQPFPIWSGKIMNETGPLWHLRLSAGRWRENRLTGKDTPLDCRTPAPETMRVLAASRFNPR